MKAIHVVAAAAVIFIAGGIGCYSSDAKNAKAGAEPPAAPDQTGAEVKWVYSLEEGRAAARQSGKPLMVDFYADWCGWCKKLDRDVYTNPEIIQLSEKFVNVKVDTDKYGKDAQAYGVRGLPTIVFLKSDGTVIQQISGYRGSEEFAKVMKEALAGAGTR